MSSDRPAREVMYEMISLAATDIYQTPEALALTAVARGIIPADRANAPVTIAFARAALLEARNNAG
jgi:hypothetical protein